MNRELINDSNCVLKSILTKQENIDILQDFIESILNIKINQIKLRNEYNNIFPRLGIAEVLIETENKEQLTVGIQSIDGNYIQNKMILYYAQLYNEPNKTVTINILDLEYFDTKEYHKMIKIKELDAVDSQKNKLGELHVLELPKLKNEPIDTKEKAWIQFLKTSTIENETKDQYEKIGKLDNALKMYWKNEII